MAVSMNGAATRKEVSRPTGTPPRAQSVAPAELRTQKPPNAPSVRPALARPIPPRVSNPLLARAQVRPPLPPTSNALRPPNPDAAAVRSEVARSAVARPQAARNPTARPDAGGKDLQTVSAQIDSYHGDPNFMTSLARGLAVIQAFSQRQRELTVSQISVKTGFSRAAVRRCLYTLARLGFASSDDSRYFHLTPRVLALGHSYLASMPLAAMAQPILENVSHILHESCSIATLDRMEIVYIARANVTRIMSIDLGVGSRLPAFCTSMGRVLMADLPEDKQNEFLAQVEYKRYTERTVASEEKLRQILRMVQRNGYCIVDQELEAGLRSLAVPIRNSTGRVVAALNVGTHAQRVSLQDLTMRFLPQLRAAAHELCLIVS